MNSYTGRQTGRQAGKQAGRQAGREAGREAGRDGKSCVLDDNIASGSGSAGGRL